MFHMSTLRSGFISTVPIASIAAEASIVSSAAGLASTTGSKPSTSTPPKMPGTSPGIVYSEAPIVVNRSMRSDSPTIARPKAIHGRRP